MRRVTLRHLLAVVRVATASAIVLAVGACASEPQEKTDVSVRLNDTRNWHGVGPRAVIDERATAARPNLAAAAKRLEEAAEIRATTLPNLDGMQAGSEMRGGRIDERGRAVLLKGDGTFVVSSKETAGLLDAGRWTPRRPNGVAALPNGSWIITDTTTTAKVFAWDQEGNLQFHRGIELAAIADSACSAGAIVFVRGRSSRDGLTVRAYDSDGRVVNAFAPGFAIGSDFVKGQLSHGLIGCLPGQDAIVTVDGAFPYVTAYRSSGSHLWTSAVSDMRLPAYTLRRSEYGTEAVRRTKELVVDTPANIADLGNGFFLFQFARATRASATDEGTVALKSVLFSAEDGSGVFLSDQMPYIISATSHGVVGVRRTPSGAHPSFALVTLQYRH